MIFVRSLIILFCIDAIISNEISSCKTPDLKNGKCILFRNCESLFSLRQNASQEYRTFINKSRCGTSDGKPLVCCPDIIEETSTDNLAIEISCKTPNDEEGICKIFKKCEHFFSIFQNKPISEENKKLIRDSKCGETEDGKQLVCCPLPRTTISTTTTTESTTTTELTTTTTTEHPGGKSCSSPKGEAGTCVVFRDCAYLFKLFKSTSMSAVTREYLSKSQCGFKDKKTYVCCVSETESTTEEPESVTTPQTHEKETEPDWLKALKEKVPQAPECGNGAQNRIFGGNQAEISEHPWTVLLGYETFDRKTGFNCGGAIINEHYVLTAAHCLETLPNRTTLSHVRVGEWNLATNPDCDEDNHCVSSVVDHKINRTVIPQNYRKDSANQHDDIALIRLENKINFNEQVRPICLPLDQSLWQKDYTRHEFDVAGWGRTESRLQSDIKMKIQIPFWTHQNCIKAYENKRTIIETQICAGGKKGQDTCNGDSGGPMMIYKSDAVPPYWYLTGVVSYGPNACGTENIPGVYTKVSSYLQWISENIQN